MAHSSDELIAALAERRVILFAGAGVSMGLKLPSWSQLIALMARDLDFDPDIFRSYGNFQSLAEYYVLKKGSIGPLRSLMDREWHSKDIRIEDSEVHNLILDLDFPILYTTNYDRWLESAHERIERSYTRIAKVDDMVKIREGVTQIVKFHGDFDDDSSLVLTESSYFDRLEFQTALDLKLRADVLGRSVLFIGYSFSDFNIRYLFYKLAKLWERVGRDGARPRSYLFQASPIRSISRCSAGWESTSSLPESPTLARRWSISSAS